MESLLDAAKALFRWQHSLWEDINNYLDPNTNNYRNIDPNTNDSKVLTQIPRNIKVSPAIIIARETFNGEAEVGGCAPGRVNLIGELDCWWCGDVDNVIMVMLMMWWWWWWWCRRAHRLQRRLCLSNGFASGHCSGGEVILSSSTSTLKITNFIVFKLTTSASLSLPHIS